MFIGRSVLQILRTTLCHRILPMSIWPAVSKSMAGLIQCLQPLLPYRCVMYMYVHWCHCASNLYSPSKKIQYSCQYVQGLSSSGNGFIVIHVQVLKGDLKEAVCTHALFYTLWRRFNALPERFDFYSATPAVAFYPLRPELIESTYMLYQVWLLYFSICCHWSSIIIS